MKFSKKAKNLTLAIAGAVALGTVATTANADSIYTVQSGDTLSGISYRFFGNTSKVDSIAQQNNIANKNFIQVGEKLVIMSDGQIKPATASQVASLPEANSSTNMANTNVASTANPSSTVANSDVASQSNVSTEAGSVAINANNGNNSANSQATNAVTTPVEANTNNNATASAYTASNNAGYSSNVSGNDATAKSWIAAHESGGNYNAQNGQYIGKYQLSASYLNGDYSPANQERVADQYVASRYGSWTNAQNFWQSHGWY